MEEYFVLIIKCIAVYFIIVIALRIMGKREVGELSVFDIVIYLVMSELLALSITNSKKSILQSLVPICTLALLQICLSFVLLKSKKLRRLFDGKPVIIIHNGKILQKNMKKERYNLDDLMNQIRSKNYSTPDEIAFAILETNGQLSVLAKKDCMVKHPEPLICDGDINYQVLNDLNKSEEWLYTQLHQQGVKSVHNVFLCIVQKNGLFVICKDKYARAHLF